MPNRRNGKHWTATASPKAGQKTDAYMLTMEAMQKTGRQEWAEHIPLSLLFLMPDKRRRDLDNLLAGSKALIDGMAQALGVDDRRFKPILCDWAMGPKEGALVAAVGVTIVSGVAL